MLNRHIQIFLTSTMYCKDTNNFCFFPNNNDDVATGDDDILFSQ